MKTRTVRFSDLTQPQQFALIDLVARNGLYRTSAGYEGSLHQPHRHVTMIALQRQGLCKIRPMSGCMGAVEPSVAGRLLIKRKFGHESDSAYVAMVAMVDGNKPEVRA